MSPGRNDSCPCGSGKKYKKCCLAKDEEAKRATQAKPAALAEPAPFTTRQSQVPKPPPDPRIEACSTRWREFKAADYEGKLDLFARTVDNLELMDGEMAFGMLNQLFGETAKHGERDRFDALVESLRDRRPEVYAAEAHYCLEWRITNAVAAGHSEMIPALARALAPLAGKEIDTFNRVESQLAFHGHLSTLVEAMRIAWPQIKSSSDIVPWGIDEHGTRALVYEILDYVERTPSPDAADPALLQRIESYAEIEPARLAAYLAHLTGRAGRQWVMSDFEFAPPRRDWDDEEEEEEAEGGKSASDQLNGEQNLYHLTVEFLGYLRRVEDVPYAKGELARRELKQFILDRHAGRLEYKESMLQAMQRDPDSRHGRRPPPKREFRRYEHLLVPDRERLDHFMASLLGMMSQLYYRAAAAFEIIPAWLRFLELRRLIDAEMRAEALSGLAGLADDLRRAFDNCYGDPALRQACTGWRRDEGKK
jgi:hypothetical protein